MGQTKYGKHETTADRIRAALKAAGHKARAVTVREPHHGDVTVTIRDGAVSLASVKALADTFRNVRYCERSGEYLQGGNTYVTVEYHDDVIAPLTMRIAERLHEAAEGYAVTIGDRTAFWRYQDEGTGNRIVSTLSSDPGAYVNVYAGWGPGAPTIAEFKGAGEILAADLLSRGITLTCKPAPAPAPTCVTCGDTGAVYTRGQVSVACLTCNPDPMSDEREALEPELDLEICIDCKASTAAGTPDPHECAVADPEPDPEPEGPVLAPSSCRPLPPFPDKATRGLASDIPREMAYAAHAGSSFVPDKRADQVRESYARELEADYQALAKYATTDEKRAQLDEEFGRYRTGYRAKYLAHLGAQSRTISSMITGPSNFPSARNRTRLDVAHKRLEELIGFRERALAAITKVLRPELRPVMAGDDNAIERLTDKIATAERGHALMKAANAAIRAHKSRGEAAQIAALVALGVSEPNAAEMLKPDFCGRIGFAAYELTNLSANIRRMKARVESVGAAKVAEVAEVEGEHAKLEDNPGDNRIRLYFPGKPDAEVRTRLKGAGFRWTPSMGCWQAYRNPNTLTVARREAGAMEVA